MLTQTSVHTKVSPASPEPDQLNYDFTYRYSGSRPHAATQIGPWAYTYDANGNVIDQHWVGSEGSDNGVGNGGSDNGNHGNPRGGVQENDGNFRFGHHEYGGFHGQDWGMQNPHYGQGGGLKDQTYVWDEENRLIHSFGPGGPTDYLYDYNGERALKRGEHGETWYIDRYYQIQNGHMIEKHIFVGDTRVVTRLEDSDFHDSGYEDHNIFYYHPDHLGSTTFVTTQDGREWEHMEYTPYGQQWIDEGTDKSIITYRFTSKEYDSETGLYYYGKRYLDPDGARWLTPDPALLSYLPATPTGDEARKENGDLPGQGGVFNFLNLNLYGYASNNPLRYVDPTGGQDNQVKPTIFTQTQWTTALGFAPKFSGNACSSTSVLNAMSTQYTKLTGKALTLPQATSMMKNAIAKGGGVGAEDSFVYNWATAANSMWDMTGLKGKWASNNGSILSLGDFYRIDYISTTGSGRGNHFVLEAEGGAIDPETGLLIHQPMTANEAEELRRASGLPNLQIPILSTELPHTNLYFIGR